MIVDPTKIHLLARLSRRRAADVAAIAKKQGKEKKPDIYLVSLVFPGR